MSYNKLVSFFASIAATVSAQVVIEEAQVSACSETQYFDTTVLKCQPCPRDTANNIQLIPATDRKSSLTAHFH